MAKIAVIGIGIYLFCQSAAFWGELLYSKNKIQFCLEQSIDGREAAELLKRDEEFTKESGYEKPEAISGVCIWGEKKQAVLPLLIRVNGRGFEIPVADIFYGESDGRKIILHTKNGVYTYYEKMELLEQKLGNGFFRSHRGFLVSLKEVAGYDRTSITLKCRDTVFLAKQKYNDFVEAYMNYLTGR